MKPSEVPIRSTWPTPIGRPLSDRMISKYQKMGFYDTTLGPRTPTEKSAKEKLQHSRKKALRRVKHNLEKLLEEFGL